MVKIGTSLALCALLAGCGGGDSSGPDPSIPQLGRYDYAFSAQGLTANGTMVLTYATADSIAGHFEVPNYEATFSLGFKNVDAYLVYAHPLEGGIAATRLRPDTQGGLDCTEGRYIVALGDSRLGTCSTEYQGPE